MSRRKGTNRPKNVDGQGATRTLFYKKLITKIIKGIFEVKMNDEYKDAINLDYLLSTILFTGFIIFTKTPAGVLALRGTVTGNNYQYMPTSATIVVPGLSEMQRTIGKDCEILYLERTYENWFWTFTELRDVYAEKFASADAAIDVNLMNSRAAFIAEAETKAQSETIKQLYEDISNGDPLVVYRTNELAKGGLNVFFGNVKNNFITDMLQDAKRSIMNELLTILGVNNANTDKRERLITAEADANNVELDANVSLWKENLRLGSERINKMFPELGFSIKLRYDPELVSAVEMQKGVEANDTSKQRGTVADS